MEEEDEEKEKKDGEEAHPRMPFVVPPLPAKKEGSVRSFNSDDHHATLGSHHATETFKCRDCSSFHTKMHATLQQSTTLHRIHQHHRSSD